MPQQKHESPELAQLRMERDKAEKKAAQYQNQMTRLENRMKYLQDAERRERTHRLCTRAGAMESMVPELKELTDAEFFTLMEHVTELPEFRREMRRIIEQRKEATTDGTVPFPLDAD